MTQSFTLFIMLNSG